MNSEDQNTVSDTTAVEKEDKPESLLVLRHENNAELEVLCKSTDEGKISVSELDLGAVKDVIDDDADNSESKEVISSASSPSFADTSEGNSNLCQFRDAEASVEPPSDYACAGNMKESTEVWNQDFKADTIKNIRGFFDRLPFEFTIGDIIPPFRTVESGEKRLVDLPGKLKSVRSLKDLSAKKIPVLGWPRWKTRNISESEIHHRKICSTQNWNKDLSSKDKEQNAGPSKSSELEPGPSDIPPTEGEGITVVPAEQREVQESGEDNERKAFFYISSSSIPGMNNGSERSSVSAGYQMPSERPDSRFARQESREPVKCLGTQRCHYIVIAIALLTTVIGCIVYHLSHSGIVAEDLRTVGSTTALVSFAVCVFSSIYVGYLNNYPVLMPNLIMVPPHMTSTHDIWYPHMVPNYEMLGDVDSVMAMNRISNPEFYTDNGYHRTEDYDFIRQTQSADVLDRRGYWGKQEGSQTEVKRFAEESGKNYSSQPQKKFKPENVVPDEIIPLTDLGFAITSCGEETDQSNPGKEVSDKNETDNMHENCHTSSEKSTDSKISNNPNESNTNL